MTKRTSRIATCFRKPRAIRARSAAWRTNPEPASTRSAIRGCPMNVSVASRKRPRRAPSTSPTAAIAGEVSVTWSNGISLLLSRRSKHSMGKALKECLLVFQSAGKANSSPCASVGHPSSSAAWSRSPHRWPGTPQWASRHSIQVRKSGRTITSRALSIPARSYSATSAAAAAVNGESASRIAFARPRRLRTICRRPSLRCSGFSNWWSPIQIRPSRTAISSRISSAT
jgi:hypothetical protein